MVIALPNNASFFKKKNTIPILDTRWFFSSRDKWVNEIERYSFKRWIHLTRWIKKKKKTTTAATAAAVARCAHANRSNGLCEYSHSVSFPRRILFFFLLLLDFSSCYCVVHGLFCCLFCTIFNFIEWNSTKRDEIAAAAAAATPGKYILSNRSLKRIEQQQKITSCNIVIE